MNLSPSDMKNLLHHILSGKEFGVERSGECGFSLAMEWVRDSPKLKGLPFSRSSYHGFSPRPSSFHP